MNDIFDCCNRCGYMLLPGDKRSHVFIACDDGKYEQRVYCSVCTDILYPAEKCTYDKKLAHGGKR
jgi:hypothetical protein